MRARHASIAKFQDLQLATQSSDDFHSAIFEITGTAGDAYFMDTRIIHSGALNINDKRKVMATYGFVRTEWSQTID